MRECISVLEHVRASNRATVETLCAPPWTVCARIIEAIKWSIGHVLVSL